MPTSSTTVLVAGTSVQLVGQGFGTKYVYVQNADDTIPVWIGGSSIGSATGILASGSSPTVFQLNADDDLWAYSAGTVTVNVLTVA